MGITILGIESSCDDTSAAVIRNRHLLSNSMAGQEVHEKYGGVVPELASRAHQQHIVPVVDMALKKADVDIRELDAIAFTRGPGLLGSLLVGSSFAKGLALALDIPIIAVNHLMGHVHALFLPEEEEKKPSLPFICLLVSGGHTQLMRVDDPLTMETLGKTIDDAAGEAFDKCAKMMGLPYPGGPVIDQLAATGDPDRFSFAMPKVKGLDFSFSGLKTSFLYFLRDRQEKDPDFISNNKNDLAASLQNTIINCFLCIIQMFNIINFSHICNTQCINFQSCNIHQITSLFVQFTCKCCIFRQVCTIQCFCNHTNRTWFTLI